MVLFLICTLLFSSQTNRHSLLVCTALDSICVCVCVCVCVYWSHILKPMAQPWQCMLEYVCPVEGCQDCHPVQYIRLCTNKIILSMLIVLIVYSTVACHQFSLLPCEMKSQSQARCWWESAALSLWPDSTCLWYSLLHSHCDQTQLVSDTVCCTVTVTRLNLSLIQSAAQSLWPDSTCLCLQVCNTVTVTRLNLSLFHPELIQSAELSLWPHSTFLCFDTVCCTDTVTTLNISLFWYSLPHWHCDQSTFLFYPELIQLQLKHANPWFFKWHHEQSSGEIYRMYLILFHFSDDMHWE